MTSSSRPMMYNMYLMTIGEQNCGHRGFGLDLWRILAGVAELGLGFYKAWLRP